MQRITENIINAISMIKQIAKLAIMIASVFDKSCSYSIINVDG